jgi:hypothetical protein
MTDRCALFLEDAGHDTFVGALVQRIAAEVGAEVSVDTRNASGGAGRAIKSLRRYLKDLDGGAEFTPDVLVIAIDADVGAFQQKRTELIDLASQCSLPPERIAVAVPDPHIEAWYLCDGAAVASVAGSGATQSMLPDGKRDKTFYKAELERVFESAGVEPPLGGTEYGDEIADAIDLKQGCQRSASLDSFVSDLRAAMKQLLLSKKS